MKMSYEPVRSIMVWSAAFCLFGPLPRLLGILETQPKHIQWVAYMDTVAWLVFGGSLVWSAVTIVHNAVNAGTE